MSGFVKCIIILYCIYEEERRMHAYTFITFIILYYHANDIKTESRTKADTLEFLQCTLFARFFALLVHSQLLLNGIFSYLFTRITSLPLHLHAFSFVSALVNSIG